MIERILENWLVNASERTFQIPFCYMLQAEGYTVLHLTRHCSMEMGKDILALDPDGNPCAYQLKSTKGNKITLKQWRDEISNQVNDLLLGKIIHPSINSAKPHRSFLVTNGELEEEVIRAIDDLNRGWVDRGHPEIRLETLVRGHLFEKAKGLGSSLWPTELNDIKTFLEIFLFDGSAQLPKDKLAKLMSSILFQNNEKKPGKAEYFKRISSSALVCSLSTSSFTNKENFNAEIEAWAIYLSYVFAYVEKWGISWKDIKSLIDIALTTIYNSLGLLCDELIRRSHYVEGDALTDQPLYRVRITRLIGLMSAYALWRQFNKEQENEHDQFIKKFCLDNKDKLLLWGEGAMPQFLSFFWYWKTKDASPKPDFFIGQLINFITMQNKANGNQFLATPYLCEADILPHLLGVTNEKFEDSHHGSSYSIEGLIHLFVRRLWKQTIKLLWPDVTKLSYCSFVPEEKWQYYLWRSEKGTNISKYPPLTKDWAELRIESQERNGEDIPVLLKQEYIFFLIFLITFPHRIRADIIRWLDYTLSYN